MSSPDRPNISLPSGFHFNQVPPRLHIGALEGLILPPSLGPLADFTGNWAGHGFNTIFRPDNSVTPTQLPNPSTQGDNVLEINLTSEDLAFSPSLGSVPNRGTTPQGDLFLNGVPYLQTIQDVTNPAMPVGIHVEPGLWMNVPGSNSPSEPANVVRMASIPHGTTIQAQGTGIFRAGPPTIPPVDITPFPIGQPGNKIRFPSQTASNAGTRRIPQDLSSFIAAGTITQAMLDDPNSFLRNHIAHQTIINNTVIQVSTLAPPSSIATGGGTDNIAFLQGPPQNANAFRMDATFWIETVEVFIPIPVHKPGQPPIVIPGQASGVRAPIPSFIVQPPTEILVPRTLHFTFLQIQYSQTVFLNFAGLTWPHVSVATLLPVNNIPIPPSAWA